MTTGLIGVVNPSSRRIAIFIPIDLSRRCNSGFRGCAQIGPSIEPVPDEWFEALFRSKQFHWKGLAPQLVQCPNSQAGPEW